MIQQVTKNDKGEEQVKVLATADDIGTRDRAQFDTRTGDAAYKFVAPVDATYRVNVRDGYSALSSDPRLVYRLAIRKQQPDFRLVAVPRDPWGGLVLRQGDRATIDVLAERRDNLEEPIVVSVTGLAGRRDQFRSHARTVDERGDVGPDSRRQRGPRDRQLARSSAKPRSKAATSLELPEPARQTRPMRMLSTEPESAQQLAGARQPPTRAFGDRRSDPFRSPVKERQGLGDDSGGDPQDSIHGYTPQQLQRPSAMHGCQPSLPTSIARTSTSPRTTHPVNFS